MNNLELVKQAIKYIPGLTLSGTAKFVEHGYPYDKIDDIDVFSYNDDSTRRLIAFLNDNGYKGCFVDSYGNLFTNSFEKVQEGEKRIEIHELKNKKYTILTEIWDIVSYKIHRYFTSKNQKDRNDIVQIKLLCEILLQEKGVQNDKINIRN